MDDLHDRQRLLAFIARYPFATLVTPASNGLRVSHVPLLVRRREGRDVLAGHVARANDHWRVMSSGAPSTAIFHGPHAYVSPSWYATAPAVPTWNYAVVHVTGAVRVDDAEGAAEALVGELTARYESGAGAWSPSSLRADFRRKLLGGIVAFELLADRIEGKLKLGQNRDVADRLGVIARLEAVGTETSQELAEMMRATLRST
jgi:transcriptional regulator